jgi:hypothetical protein
VRERRPGSSGLGTTVTENEGHSLARRENIIAFLARAGRFLEQNLR